MFVIESGSEFFDVSFIRVYLHSNPSFKTPCTVSRNDASASGQKKAGAGRSGFDFEIKKLFLCGHRFGGQGQGQTGFLAVGGRAFDNASLHGFVVG